MRLELHGLKGHILVLLIYELSMRVPSPFFVQNLDSIDLGRGPYL